jgi:hypothetical protein
MRLVTAIALTTSAFALAACAGGGGELSAAGVRASKANCTVLDSIETCMPTPTGGGGGTTVVDTDGDGIPDGDTGGDGDGTTGSGAGGNGSGPTTGNQTIALQKFVLDKPTKATDPAISQLTSNGATFAATEADILSVNKPKTLKFTIDTKSVHNAEWAVPAEMPEWQSGTRDLRWIEHGHTTVNFANAANYDIKDTKGNPVKYNVAKGVFEYTVDHTDTDGLFHSKEEVVEHFSDDVYWDQIKQYMGSKANAGTKDSYREYWNQDTATNRDEMMQVWAWKDSYAVQYQNQIGLGVPKQQAWSFGGTKATKMKASGKSQYAGRYVAVTKPGNWQKNKNGTIDPNKIWMEQGRLNLVADFDTSSIIGTASTESMTSEQNDAWYTWYTKEAETSAAGEMTHAKSTDVANYYKFMDAKKTFTATIVANGTVDANGDPVKNSFSGTAALPGDYKLGDNALKGGFFDTKGNSVTGIYSIDSTTKQLVGGTTGNADPKEATLHTSGAFNGECVASPGYACNP